MMSDSKSDHGASGWQRLLEWASTDDDADALIIIVTLVVGYAAGALAARMLS